MRIRASVLTFTKIGALAAAATLAGCGGGGAGKIMADTPALPYVAPDVDDISGTDPSDEAEPAPAGASSAQNPQK